MKGQIQDLEFHLCFCDVWERGDGQGAKQEWSNSWRTEESQKPKVGCWAVCVFAEQENEDLFPFDPLCLTCGIKEKVG